MSDDSSELSSAPSEDDNSLQLTKKDGILKFFSKATPKAAPKKEDSPPIPPREPSPPHEYVLSDNGDIAVRLSFQCRVPKASARANSRQFLLVKSY
jgi:hypothetical protein